MESGSSNVNSPLNLTGFLRKRPFHPFGKCHSRIQSSTPCGHHFMICGTRRPKLSSLFFCILLYQICTMIVGSPNAISLSTGGSPESQDNVSGWWKFIKLALCPSSAQDTVHTFIHQVWSDFHIQDKLGRAQNQTHAPRESSSLYADALKFSSSSFPFPPGQLLHNPPRCGTVWWCCWNWR